MENTGLINRRTKLPLGGVNFMDITEMLLHRIPNLDIREAGNCILVTPRSDRTLRRVRELLRYYRVQAVFQWVSPETFGVFLSAT